MSQSDMAGFYIAGLLNNAGYVIMLAGAKNIAPGYVGVVYVCNVVPSITVKITGPYWYHLISYKNRVIMSSVLMACSFIMVALGTTADAIWLQLLGVIVGSVQSGFGEASFLALTAFYESRTALTYWSSGTGLAGIFGYGWVVIFTIAMNASFQLTLYVALILPMLFWLNFNFLLKVPEISREKDEVDDDEIRANGAGKSEAGMSLNVLHAGTHSNDGVPSDDAMLVDGSSTGESRQPSTAHPTEDLSEAAASMSFQERMNNTLSLWPFMIPLFVVYFAEYAMQSGVWSAMGFPVSSENARDNFYEFSNFMYQGGVLVSRSSGMLYKADMKTLWLFPVLQLVLLVFFILDAYYQFWYDWSLLVPCFVVGLLGGAVYVGGFSLLAETVPPHLKEFSLSAASLADGAGIALSTIAGIFIQQALYKYHNVDDD